ncbi:MAG: SHOCT domain-containing protein [Rubrivivax sp.]|nr:SHOCT domain-containing protein [Rubrivivax sp.]
MKRWQTGAAAGAMVLALAGCGSTEVVAPTVSVSTGQQLIDLKKARDSGALTQAEYEKQKANLIANVK